MSKRTAVIGTLTATLIAVAWSAFQLYTAGFGLFHIMIQRPLHVAFALMLTYVLFPKTRGPGKRSVWLDYLPALLGLLIAVYFILEFPRMATRMELVDPVLPWDKFFGLVTVLLILEACRRTTGPVLPLIGLLFILYAFLGVSLPGILRHQGMTLESFTDIEFLSAQGLFSTPVGVSAEVVFYFVLFGAFLQQSGCSKLFNDLAFSLTGRSRGGPAKVSVVASSLFGMVSGSAVGNVVVTGSFTIPAMKRAGYKPSMAGAVEAVASTGGQIMPPIMGAAAFLMIDLAGVPYSKIMVAAIVPAVLYYISCFCVVDFEAWRLGLGARASDAPDTRREILKRIHLVIPLGVLIYLIMNFLSLMRAAFFSIICILVVSWLRKDTRMDLRKVVVALEEGARSAIMVAIPSAMAGIIVGILVYTGLGLKLTGMLVQASGGNLLVALFCTMIACIILGMGMPTSTAYLLTATLLAPALISLGLPVLVAHMFIFSFAVLSMITPPVALATYAAASIAESGIWSTGITAFRMSFGSFLIPYAFVYHPGLLLQGAVAGILWSFSTAALGVLLLAAVNVGFLFTRMSIMERVVLFICSVLLIHPGLYTSLLGLAVGLLMVYLLRRRSVTVAWGM